MKSCPTCNRTFEDSFFYCLDNGGVLSAPYDSQATQVAPLPAITQVAPTEASYPITQQPGRTPALTATIAAPPPPLYSPEHPSRQPAKPGLRTNHIFVIGIVVVVLLAAIGGVMFFGAFNNRANSLSANRDLPSTTNSSKRSACLSEESGADLKDREGHYSWAKQRDAGTLGRNLQHKIDLLFQCPEMDEDRLSSAFADISTLTARSVPDADCFGGDTGVTDTDRQHHKDAFPKDPNRREKLLKNLKWKIEAALKCLKQSEQADYFANVSVLIANAPP